MLVRLLIGQRAGEIVEMQFAQAQHLLAAGQVELPEAGKAAQDLSAAETAATVPVPAATAGASANVQAPAKSFSGLPIPRGPRGRSRGSKK